MARAMNWSQARCVDCQLSQLLRKEVHIVVHVATKQHVAESSGSSDDIITCDGDLKTMHPHWRIRLFKQVSGFNSQFNMLQPETVLTWLNGLVQNYNFNRWLKPIQATLSHGDADHGQQFFWSQPDPPLLGNWAIRSGWRLLPDKASLHRGGERPQKTTGATGSIKGSKDQGTLSRVLIKVGMQFHTHISTIVHYVPSAVWLQRLHVWRFWVTCFEWQHQLLANSRSLRELQGAAG